MHHNTYSNSKETDPHTAMIIGIATFIPDAVILMMFRGYCCICCCRKCNEESDDREMHDC
jgi:hypothetical protein